MTTFSKINFKTLNYNSFRPHYPSSFYKVLVEYVTKGDSAKIPLDKAIDLGCGTGVATYPLLNTTKEVFGLDLSPSMIKTADSLIDSRCKELGIEDHPRIKFRAGAVEDFLYTESGGAREIPDESVDLITAAQCIHWFKDYDAYFKNCYKLLKKGGTLSYFFYIDPVIIDFRVENGKSITKDEKLEILKRSKELYHNFVYNDPSSMGPHWENPGRNILKDYCEEVNKSIPTELYDDVKINTFIPDFETGKTVPNDEVDLDLKKMDIPLSGFVDYLTTYSAYHTFKDTTGDPTNILETYVSNLEKEFGWDRNTTKIDLVWNTGYTFMTKK
ncbi:trans-aconitate methyltransferase 2 [Scheffersomyces coipomensis]|uniref:trans-aconitate methyltransferase 2 n=1 Tax=Scheffersomyces coipomensis TaxID=1788519 RepID=UPI00315D8E13